MKSLRMLNRMILAIMVFIVGFGVVLASSSPLLAVFGFSLPLLVFTVIYLGLVAGVF